MARHENLGRISGRAGSDAAEIQTVAVIGTGVIGSGWAAHFLRTGLSVVAFDPSPGAEARLRAMVDRVWPIAVGLGLRPGASPNNLTFAPSMEAAVELADFVQESAFEEISSKRTLLREIDQVARDGVVVASSTSGFGMTEMASECVNPQRFVVGHPFHPVYLVPLVEVVPGEETDAHTVSIARALYESGERHCVVLPSEIPGFVGNRLQEAIWNEAAYLIADGHATVEDIEAIVVHGPGLRWPVCGPILTMHLGGGPGGMRRTLEHFDGVTDTWSHSSKPEMSLQLKQDLVIGSDVLMRGRSFEDMERARDEFLVDLLALKERHFPTGSHL